MRWSPTIRVPGAWGLFEGKRRVALIWPVVRPTAFGDWEYTVGDYYSGRERGEGAAKKKVEELLNQKHDTDPCKIS